MPEQDSQLEGTFEITANQLQVEHHDWLLWQMWFPYIFYMMILVAIFLFTGRWSKAAEAVLQGDPLLLTSMLLIGVSTYFSLVRPRKVQRAVPMQVKRFERNSLFLSIVVLIAYTIVKIYAVVGPCPESILLMTTESGSMSITTYLVLGFTVAIAFLGWSYARYLRKWVYEQRIEWEAD